MSIINKYCFSGYHIDFSDSDFQRIPEDLKKKIVNSWFLQRYCDPVHNMPYETREGGYQYFNRGPFAALNILQENFSGKLPENLIEDIAQEIEKENSSDLWVYTDSYSTFLNGSDDH